MTAPIDYNAVLADLMAKRGQIDAAIEVIRSMIGSGVAPEIVARQGSDGAAGEDPSATVQSRVVVAEPSDPGNIYFGLSTAAAAKKFLATMKRPQSPRVIAAALRAGGQVSATDEKVAYQNTYTAMSRSKDFVKTRNKEWGLAEWYTNKQKGEE